MTSEPSQETTTFVLSYDGDALTDHRMPVREFAPALLAVSDAFERANRLLNEDRAEVTLDVHGTHAGSFEVELLLTAIGSAAVPMLTGQGVTAAINLKTVFFDNGLFSMLKRLRGVRPEVVERSGPEVMISAGGDVYYYNQSVVTLYDDRQMRHLARQVTQPLLRDGVDTLSVRDSGGVLETVREDDVGSFVVGSSGHSDDSTTREFTQRGLFLQPAVTRLVGRGRWRLTDGAKTNSYDMADEAFRKRVEEGLRVGARDTLDCDVTVEQALGRDGTIEARYRVDRVNRHIPYSPAEQLRFHGGDDHDETP